MYESCSTPKKPLSVTEESCENEEGMIATRRRKIGMVNKEKFMEIQW